MWLPNPSVETLTRPRLAVAILSAVAAVSAGYYAYQANTASANAFTPGRNLHRSNAVRRRRRSRQPRDGNRRSSASSTASENIGDENINIFDVPPAAGDRETVVDDDDGAGAAEEWWNEPSGFPQAQRAGHNIVNLLFRVSEDNARRNGCVHRGCQCNSCGQVPIRGVRYRCANCADFDLCETCEAQGVHIKTHIFYKIRVPAPPFGPRQMQPVWYTGDPDTCRRNLPRALIAKLSKETGFERPELEAFWEQWTFMANAEWREDPDDLCVAMDRKTFERCLVPTGGSRHAAPNLIHDRMFSFYDSNNDGLIGFAEFLHGLSYRRHKDKLRKVFEGYDIDADGYVDRQDFLRMFRAYYVLYKQMHKDILDSLEDQLLASTDAQQLVTSRQPLSSLFGREGRVPSADRTSRFEGKTYQCDGHVEIENDYENAVIDDQPDTAGRQDILTSLFAYETDQRSRRRLITRNDTDTEWRTVRRLSGAEADRTYWVTLLDPPATLEELPDAIMGNRSFDLDEAEIETDDEDDVGGQGSRNDLVRPRDSLSSEEMPPATESEARARRIEHDRQQKPRLEKRRREMARNQLHDRWKRRQFYLDEEEGGDEPEDWESDEDVLAQISAMVEEYKLNGDSEGGVSGVSHTNSKAKLPNGADDSEIPFNLAGSSKNASERRAGIHIPMAEKDAGKEILYQITQQAFNELLDAIFKPIEDEAIRAAETKTEREKFKDEIDAVQLPPEEEGEIPPPQPSRHAEKAVDHKSLEELLSETGYSIIPQEPSEPRNAVEIDNAAELSADESLEDEDTSVESFDDDEDEDEPEDHHRDPTMPQNKPNSAISEAISVNGRRSEAPPPRSRSNSGNLPFPTLDTLREWKRLGIAEERAKARGGWGRRSFEEFENIYKKSQGQRINRLDYLGSWIDFCIP